MRAERAGFLFVIISLSPAVHHASGGINEKIKGCCSKVIMSGCANDNPDDERTQAAGVSKESLLAGFFELILSLSFDLSGRGLCYQITLPSDPYIVDAVRQILFIQRYSKTDS